jgi:hypothetical protein
MTPGSASELVDKLKRLVSESNSLAAQFGELEEIIKSKNEEIELLQSMLDESHARISMLENRVEELAALQEKLGELEPLPFLDPTMPASGGETAVTSPDHGDEADELRMKNIRLQEKLDELHEQLLTLKRESLSVLQYKQRIIELESRIEFLEHEKENTETTPS